MERGFVSGKWPMRLMTSYMVFDYLANLSPFAVQAGVPRAW